jgi:hypothetical protein
MEERLHNIIGKAKFFNFLGLGLVFQTSWAVLLRYKILLYVVSAIFL